MSKKFQKKKDKVIVKKKFKNAILKMNTLSSKKQREIAKSVSAEFIRDLEAFLRKIRKKGHLFTSSQKKIMKKHKGKLRDLADSKVSLERKRKILSMKGGFKQLVKPILRGLLGTSALASAFAIQANS